MIKGLTLVEVIALRAFTKTTKHGQFHGDPNGNPKAKRPSVPDYVVEELVASGRVMLPEGEALSPATGDGSGTALPPIDEPIAKAEKKAPAEPTKRQTAVARMNAARAAKAAERKAAEAAKAEDEADGDTTTDDDAPVD